MPKRRKAWIFTSAPGTPTHELLKYYSNRRVAEENVFSLILSLFSEQQSAAVRIVEDEIGLVPPLRASKGEELGLLWHHYLAMLSLQRLRDLGVLLEFDTPRAPLKRAA